METLPYILQNKRVILQVLNENIDKISHIVEGNKGTLLKRNPPQFPQLDSMLSPIMQFSRSGELMSSALRCLCVRSRLIEILGKHKGQRTGIGRGSHDLRPRCDRISLFSRIMRFLKSAPLTY